jgi:hypothetical protein
MVVQQYSVHGGDARVFCELSELPIGILFRRSNKYPLEPLLPLAFSMSHISPSRDLGLCVSPGRMLRTCITGFKTRYSAKSESLASHSRHLVPNKHIFAVVDYSSLCDSYGQSVFLGHAERSARHMLWFATQTPMSPEDKCKVGPEEGGSRGNRPPALVP